MKINQKPKINFKNPVFYSRGQSGIFLDIGLKTSLDGGGGIAVASNGFPGLQFGDGARFSGELYEWPTQQRRRRLTIHDLLWLFP